MFQTFKSEIAVNGQQKMFTIYTYIRFLDAIEKYIRAMDDCSEKFCILL